MKLLVALWATLVAVGCGPTRTQLFVETSRLGDGDGPVDDEDGGLGDPPGDLPDAGVVLTLDPDAVFEWEQTPPGDGDCGPGTYVGTARCTTETPEQVPIEGVINLTLVPGPAETGLLISPGSVSLVDPLSMDPNAAQFWHAALVGTVECGAGALEAVSTADQQVMALFPVFGGPFDIRLDGSLDPDQQTFAGTIVVTQQVTGVRCSGDWSAKRTP